MKEEERLALAEIFVNQIEDTSLDGKDIFELIFRTDTKDIISIIRYNKENLVSISTKNIPQFSDANDIGQVLNIIINSSQKLNFKDIGHFLCKKGAKPGAKCKYGENHYKLTSQLGLAAKFGFQATDLGLAYSQSKDQEKKVVVVKKLALRIPILQQSLLSAEFGECNIYALLILHLSQSTAIRRGSNIRTLLSWIFDVSDVDTQHTLNNIVWRK